MMDKKWEMFCDHSYYDQWCVREIGSKKIGEGFHVSNKSEAEGLLELLNSLNKSIALAVESGEALSDQKWADAHLGVSPEVAEALVLISACVEYLEMAGSDNAEQCVNAALTNARKAAKALRSRPTGRSEAALEMVEEAERDRISQKRCCHVCSSFPHIQGCSWVSRLNALRQSEDKL